MSSLDDHALTQVQKEPTRDKNILDLCITNKPGLIKSSRSVPGILDHCAVLTESDINRPYRRSTARPVHQFKKASWENIRQEIRIHWASFSKDSPNNSVNEKWLRLKSILMDCLNKFVPTKLTSKRQNLPWLNKSLRKAIRKKARLYNRAKTSKRPDLWAKYKLQKRDTQRNLRRARWSFINDKLLTSLETRNSKPFWRYIKSQRQDRCGVSPLLHDGQLHSDSRRKAEIFNQQFCSVFTDEDTINMPKLEGPPTTPMNNIEITQSGITKLLSELNVDKAPGPDELPNLLLKNATKEISLFLTDIFERSIRTGKLPMNRSRLM